MDSLVKAWMSLPVDRQILIGAGMQRDLSA
jgi:hypothetical protein